MSWTQMMGINRTTGRVYTRAEIRELEKAAHEAGLEVGRQALREYKEREPQTDSGEADRIRQARAEGYIEALEQAAAAVEATPPQTGRKQILHMLNEQLDARKGIEA